VRSLSLVTEDFRGIDRIDSEILGVLRSDGRIPWHTLGDRVHLSANASAERVRRLLRRGVIRRFTIDLDQAALGRDLEAVVDVFVADRHAEFVAAMRERDEVTWMAHITGRFDYRLNVSCRGTSGLDALLTWMKEHGAGETNTTVVLRRLV
jgi:Lrp/AsnC family transcriptional regulator, leucine-responsive regulatory protein